MTSENHNHCQRVHALFENESAATLIGPCAIENPKPIKTPVLFVDGGLNHQSKMTFDGKGSLSVGDGDSSSDSSSDSNSDSIDIKLNTDKDHSDLSYSLSLLPANIEQIDMLGFLGGRRDHEIMNFAEVHQFLKNRSQTAVHFENKVLAYSSGTWKFNHDGEFSLFLFDPAKLNLKGDCRYSITDNQKLNAVSSHGLSNSSSGDVHLKTDSPVFVFLDY